jgi:putative restriction endonuclease
VANAVFIASRASRYDDILEERYHFPRRYLERVQQTEGDWIIYYEPRRGGGRKVYFAMARVVGVDRDPERTDHFYARMSGYQEFVVPVGLQAEQRYLESFISNSDGRLNTGAAINSVRTLPRSEFATICRLGFAPVLQALGPPATDPAVAETQAEYGETRGYAFTQRAIRDAAFRTRIQISYDRACAMTGLRLVAEERSEVEAAHIRPVEENGPDSTRNGMALCRTVHWLFDRGFVSVTDDGQILRARRGVPDAIRRLFNPDDRIRLPLDSPDRPHALFLRWHREHRFRG